MPILFDYPPHWKLPVKETREYLTDIIQQKKMLEQRIALRSKPRCKLEYRVQVNRNKLASFDYLTWATQSEDFVVPYWPRSEKTSAPISGGANSFSLNSIPYDMQAGEYVVFSYPGKTTELHVIDSVTVNAITLVTNLIQDWPVGTRVFPGWLCKLTSTIDTSRPASGVAEFNVILSRLPNAMPASDHSYTPDLSVSGTEALIRRMNWLRGMSVQHSVDTVLIDSQVGPFLIENIGRIARRTRKGSVLVKNHQEAEWWMAFYDRMKGRQGEFIAPTWQQDLPLQTPIGSGYEFEVPGTDLGIYMASNDVYTHICAIKKDGSLGFYEILDFISDGGLGVTRVDTLDSWDESYPPEDIYTCFANRVRLATDTLTFNWLSSGVAEIPLSVITVEAQS